jgi:hypothetical protein
MNRRVRLTVRLGLIHLVARTSREREWKNCLSVLERLILEPTRSERTVIEQFSRHPSDGGSGTNALGLKKLYERRQMVNE